MGACYSAHNLPSSDTSSLQKLQQLVEGAKEDTSIPIQLVQSILEIQLKPNRKAKSGVSLLHSASEAGNAIHCKILLSIGADPNLSADYTGSTPLIAAASNGFEECVEVLLNAGAQVNSTDRWGCTALFKASCYSHVRCVETLLRHGACPNLSNKWGALPLQYAAHLGYTAVVQALVDNHADLTLHKELTVPFPLSAAASRGHAECVEILLKAGAPTNYSPNNNNKNALCHAIAGTHSYYVNREATANGTCVEKLIETGSVVSNECISSLVLTDSDSESKQINHRVLQALPISSDKQTEALRDVFIKNVVKNRTRPHSDTICLFHSVGLYISPEDVKELESHNKENSALQNYSRQLLSISKTPRSLMSLCRLKVRSTLQPNVNVCLEKLPLPKLMRDYVGIANSNHYDTIDTYATEES